MMKATDVFDKLLNEEMLGCNADNLFFELYIIDPSSCDISISELHVYPLEWFHNRKIHQELCELFTTVIDNYNYSGRQKFRAFLALMYLNGLNTTFSGYSKFLSNKRNKSAYDLAQQLFDSEHFAQLFIAFDAKAMALD